MATGTITGLSSGLDWKETVDLLMQIERQSLTMIEDRRSTYESQLTHWGTIEAKLGSLVTAAQDLDTGDKFLVKSVSSNDEDVVEATATDKAIPGGHDVIVNRLATNHIMVHTTGWADADLTPINESGSSQSFSYNYDDETRSIVVPDGTTLEGLVYLINNDEDNPGVTASILNDGSGGDGAYHLVLSGQDTGQDYAVTIVDTEENPTSVGDGSLFDNENWSTTRESQNTQIRVDGFPGEDLGWPVPWIETASNDVEDVIPGVTIKLKDLSDGDSIHIEISVDKDIIEENVNSLLGTYNELISEMQSLTYYDTETEKSGPLFGDTTVRSIRGTLQNVIGNVIPGTSEDDVYRSLGQVGVSMTAGGNLTLDTEVFEEALDADPNGVARLFVFDSISTSSHMSVVDHDENTVGGVYDYTLTYDADGNLDPEGVNTINGEEVVLHGTRLAQGADGSNVEGLLVQITNPGNGPGSITGSVKVYTGLSALFDKLATQISDAEDGEIKYSKDRINDTIDLLDKRIESWERRLETTRQTYESQFLRMETLIGQLKSQGDYVDAVL